MKKKVIIYAYHNSPSSNYNLDFFIKKELRYRPDVDYILEKIQGMILVLTWSH